MNDDIDPSINLDTLEEFKRKRRQKVLANLELVRQKKKHRNQGENHA